MDVKDYLDLVGGTEVLRLLIRRFGASPSTNHMIRVGSNFYSIDELTDLREKLESLSRDLSSEITLRDAPSVG